MCKRVFKGAQEFNYQRIEYEKKRRVKNKGIKRTFMQPLTIQHVLVDTANQ